MNSCFSTINKVLLTLGLAAFLALSIFGVLPSAMSMGLSESITTTNCLLMTGQAVVCNMNPLEHIATWQSMFVTTFKKSGSDLLTSLLTALALAFMSTRLLRPKLQPELALATPVIKSREISLPSPLFQELFSNGILNPKLF